MNTIIDIRPKKKSKQKDLAELVKFSQLMQSEPTLSENVALAAFRDNGVVVETQVVFGFYILDFVIPSKMLVVELDGSSHTSREAYDWKRDQFVMRYGLHVLRVKNENAASVVERINKIPIVDAFEKKWGKAQELAGRAKTEAFEGNTPSSRPGKVLYTPKRHQAHVIAEKAKKAAREVSSLSKPDEVLDGKRKRLAHQAEMKLRREGVGPAKPG